MKSRAAVAFKAGEPLQIYLIPSSFPAKLLTRVPPPFHSVRAERGSPPFPFIREGGYCCPPVKEELRSSSLMDQKGGSGRRSY